MGFVLSLLVQVLEEKSTEDETVLHRAMSVIRPYLSVELGSLPIRCIQFTSFFPPSLLFDLGQPVVESKECTNTHGYCTEARKYGDEP